MASDGSMASPIQHASDLLTQESQNTTTAGEMCERTQVNQLTVPGRAGGVWGKEPLGTKPRGANWTEIEALVLIEQKRLEYEERHHPDIPTSATFIYGKDAWRLITNNCNAVQGFRMRTSDQVQSKWDNLQKEFKKLKDYITSSGAPNWWSLSKSERRDIAKVRKLSVEFTEAMYDAMDVWQGQRRVFLSRMNLVDSDKATKPMPTFGRTAVLRPSPCAMDHPPSQDIWAPTPSPAPSVAPSPTVLHCSRMPQSTTMHARATTPSTNMVRDSEPHSSGRKRAASSDATENLVDFIKEFNHDYLARSDVADLENRHWRSNMLTLERERENQLATKDLNTTAMDEKMYELEMQKIHTVENMTNALLKMATTMENLTRNLDGRACKEGERSSRRCPRSPEICVGVECNRTGISTRGSSRRHSPSEDALSLSSGDD